MDGASRLENARSEFELDELVGLIGNAYVRRGLSPPSQLHGAVRHWLGLTHGGILAAIDRHFDEHHRLYASGSGDGLFYLVEAEIRRAWQAKHPARDRADDEPERPRRRRTGGARKVYNASGFPDAIVDGGLAARLLRDRDQAGPVELRSNLRGYESAGEAILEDDDSGEDA
jgi:hypothetical protein